MSKLLDINDVKDWNTAEKYADQHGLPAVRTSGGHRIHSNKNGSMPFSTHEKEMSKGLLHSVKKQLLRLCIMTVALYAIYLQMPANVQKPIEDVFFWAIGMS